MRMLITFCLLIAAALPAMADEYPIGDLAITYDPAQWSFSRIQVGDPLVSQPDVFWATCKACRGDDPVVVISVGDVTREESRSVIDPMWDRNKVQSTTTVGEITFEITTIISPCRNYVPPSVAAYATYKGRTYKLHSGAIISCRGSLGVDHERFEELLRGVHPRKT